MSKTSPTKKFLIVLVYFERPKLVVNALNSIKEMQYENWELAFIDDGSVAEGEPIVRSIFSERELQKTTFYRCNDTVEMKKAIGGSRHGYYMNEAIKASNADYFIICCDDDAIIPTYFAELNSFLQENPLPYCFSWLKFFNPTKEHYSRATVTAREQFAGSTYALNHNDAVNPVCHIDSSQVVCNTQCFKVGGVSFPYPKTRMLDAALFQQLFVRYGLCQPTRIYGEYKGAFQEQLGNSPAEY